jgi:hypothetical protein
MLGEERVWRDQLSLETAFKRVRSFDVSTKAEYIDEDTED